MINDDGTINYRGYTLVLSDIQIHIWDGGVFIDTVHGEPQTALLRAKRIIDGWHNAP